MLVHPQFDPVALQLGPLAVHWYGLMYVAAFFAFLLLGRRRLVMRPEFGWTPTDLDDLLFWGVLGVILGGRLGEVLFYQPGYYFSHPAEILAVWKGGMSFHGGLLGVLVALWAFGRTSGRGFLPVGDFVAPLVPLGLAFGRLGNFINGELWGRPASPDLPWAMQFPLVDALPRHPSQLYQMLGEGLLLFFALWLYARKPRPVGAVSGLFLLGYGVLRFLAEFFRNPDAGIFTFISPALSSAQWLCAPMIVLGAWLMRRARG
ncbi:MAG: prolipoprotein diacylglyceryl transferase [Betaproteobacteria bacterium]|nr:prolipoprotein diacylglyceryl transferase [Betaproteobacteria bacterium]